MAQMLTYEIAVSDGDGGWVVRRTEEVRTVIERGAEDTARALLEDWIIDHPGDVAGGQRLEVFGDDPYDYPPDERSGVRVWVFLGQPVDGAREPAAAAYLVAEPDDSDLGIAG